MEVSEVSSAIGDAVRDHAGRAPSAPVLVAEGKEPLTYGGLARLMDRIQTRLNGLGFGRGDRIGIVGPNDPEMAALCIGVFGCAAAVPMNPEFTLGEFAIHLRDLKVRAVAVDAEMDSPVRAAAGEIGLPILEVERPDPRTAGMIDIRSAARSVMAQRPGPSQPDDLALVLPTSGTTSHSKIVPFSHRQYMCKVERIARSLNLTPDDRCMNLMPLFHAHGLDTSLAAVVYSGGSRVNLPEYSVEEFYRLLEAFDPTWYTGSYTFHHSILAGAARHPGPVEKSRLRFIRASSGQLDPEVADALETIFRAPVIESYSCTEMGFICSNPLPPAVHKRGTGGVVVRGKVAIMGPDDTLLERGMRGEVVVDNAGGFSGYENDPAANEQCFLDN